MSGFKDSLKEDLDCFLNPDEFATEVMYNAVKEGEIKTINGIFDYPFEADSVDTDMIVQSVNPVLKVKTCEIPGEKVRPGDFVVIEGKEFLIKEDRPDGTGLTDLGLKVK